MSISLCRTTIRLVRMLSPCSALLRLVLPVLALALSLAAPAHAQVQVVSALDKQLARIDFAVVGQGLFNTTTKGTNYLQQSISDTPGNTLGALVTLRYTVKPYFGLEGNFSYARFTQNYTNIGGIQANTDEYSFGYVVHPGEFFGFRPFASVGAGSNAYKPTPGGGQGLETQARAVYYYTAGVDDMLTEHIGVRAQFRQSLSLAPDFGQNYITIKQRTISTEPGIGVFLRF